MLAKGRPGLYQAPNAPEPTPGALPIIAIHGINTSCKGFMTKAVIKGISENPYGSPVYCIEYGANNDSILNSVTNLVEKTCAMLNENAEEYNLRNGKG